MKLTIRQSTHPDRAGRWEIVGEDGYVYVTCASLADAEYLISDESEFSQTPKDYCDFESEKKYFHEMTDEEYETVSSTLTWEQVAKRYLQPQWCGYPNAIDPLGCWGIVFRKMKDKNYCKNCEFNNSRPKDTNHETKN